MSSNMTSLESQIASLHGTRSGIAIGNASRGNLDDAIGRGFQHSLDRGHALDATAKSKFHRPSVLHDDARAAADVPLTTLQSNAHDAIVHLASITANDAFSSRVYLNDILGPQSVTFERRLRSKDENEELDATLVGMLTLLSTAYGETERTDGDAGDAEDGDDGAAACTTASEYSLHVLEYLIRRYDVHVRPATASKLLTSALCQHELPLFRRILQLVDLTNVGADGQMWTFLRPYAATGKGGGAAAAPPPVPRRIISSRAARDDALLAKLLTLAADVAGVELDRLRRRMRGGRSRGGAGEGGDADDDALLSLRSAASTGCRRGVSQMISFVGAVAVEALSVQAAGGHDRGGGGGVVSESTVRSILPHLLTSCGGGGAVAGGAPPGRKDRNNPSHLLGIACPDYRNLGYVIAAQLSNLCRLGEGTREVLSVSIARGAAAAAASASASGGSPSSKSADVLEGAADAILAIASVVTSSPPPSSTKGFPGEEDEELQRGRPANLPNMGERGSSSTGAGTLPGCDLLPLSTYLALRRLGGGGDSGDYRFLAAAIGSAHHASRDLVVPLVTSALSWAVSRLSEGGDTGDDSARLIGSLANEPSLGGLWRGDGVERTGGGGVGGGGLAGPVAAEIVTSFALARSIDDDVDDDQGSSVHERNCQSCLSALHSSHRTQCEAGIAFAVTRLSKQWKSKSGAAGTGRGRKRVSHLLGPIIGAGAVVRGVGHLEEENQSTTPTPTSSSPPPDDDEGEAGGLLLPPRISLDHPSPSVRLDAIGRLVEQGSRMTMTAGGNGDAGRQIDADLIRALLGKIATDDDVGVVVAAVGAFRSLGQKGEEGGMIAAFPVVPAGEVAMAALAAIRKWGMFSDGARKLLRRSLKYSHRGEKKKKKSRKKRKKRKSRDDDPDPDDDAKEEEVVQQPTDEENPYASALRGFTSATCAALALCSSAARMISPPVTGDGMEYDLSVSGGSGGDDDFFGRLIEAIASHLLHQFFPPDDGSSQVVGWWFRGLDVDSSERLTAAARGALCQALSSSSTHNPDDSSTSSSSPKDARELLSIGDGVCLALLRKVTTRRGARTTPPPPPPRDEQDAASSTRMERGFLWVILAACTETLTLLVVEGESSFAESSYGKLPNTVSAALDAALHMLHSYDDAHCRRDAFSSEVAALRKCLHACASPPYFGYGGENSSVVAGKSVSRLIADLASVSALSAYDSIGAPSIRDLLAATRTALQSDRSTTQDCAQDDLRLHAPNVLLLEAALVVDSSSTVLGPASQRIMSLACEEISSPGTTTSSDGFSFEHGIVAAVVLFSRARGPMGLGLRELSLKYLKCLGSCKKGIKTTEKDDEKKTSMVRVFISAMSSSVLRTKLEMMEDTTDDLLPILFKQAVLESGDDAIDFRGKLLNCCVVVATTIPSSKNDERMLLIDGRADGFLAACTSVLLAMEDAGDSSFPLIERWDIAGRVLHNAFCVAEAEKVVKLDNGEELPPPSWRSSALDLMNVVVRMLKGVVVVGDETRGVAITTGPTSSGGGRARSYSVGEPEEGATALLEPYPASMADAILKSMSVTSPRSIVMQMKGVCGATIRLVVGMPSWAESVFPKMGHRVRRRMALALVTLRAVGGGEAVGSALFGLPLDSDDFVYLIRHLHDHVVAVVDDESYKLLALTHLADCIRVRAPSCGTDGLTELATLLFDRLFALSVENGGGRDDGGSDYTRECLLQTILAVCQQCVESAASTPGKKSKRGSARRRRSGSESSGRDDEPSHDTQLVSHARLLLGLLGCPDSSSAEKEAIVTPLVSAKAKTVALALLTSLCSLSPKTVLSFLLPAMMQVIAPSSLPETSVNNSLREDVSRSTEIATRSPKMAKKAMFTIVTAFCLHSRSAELSYTHLLRTFTSCFDGDVSPEIKHELYCSFVDALYSANESVDVGSAIASLLCFHLALSGFRLWVAPPKSGLSTKDYDYGEGDVAFALEVLACAQPRDQLHAIFHLHCYAGQLISVLSAASAPSVASSEVLASTKLDAPSKQGNQAETEMLVPFNEIIDVAVHGSKGMEAGTLTSPASSIDSGKILAMERRSLMFAVTGILTVAKEGLTSPAVRKVVRKSEGAEAGVCLRLWKELMQQQVCSSRARACIERSNTNVDGLEGEKLSSAANLLFEEKFWEAIPEGIQDCLVRLQKLLPAPHFLASVTALLNDDDVDPTLLRKALRLLGDRAAEVGRGSPESSLFLETVPDVAELLFTLAYVQPRGTSSRAAKSPEEGTEEKSPIRHRVMLQQAGLIAIERLAQSLCLANGKGALTNKEASVCVDALEKVSTFLKEAADRFKMTQAENNVENTLSKDTADCQLLSSAALCTASLISILGARCLSVLPTVVMSLIMSITIVNMKQRDEATVTSMDSSDHEILNLVQVSVLRCLLAVVETIPQFLAPYLGQLFEASALPSSMMREKNSSDATTTIVLERLDQALSANIPPRQLIPALGAALAKCFEQGSRICLKEAEVLTKYLESSIRLSKRAELAPVMSKSLGVLMLVFNHSGHNASEFDLLSASNRGLVALVMKLSEAQLRPLHARLRDWRGDLEVSQLQVDTSRRRYVFWSLSATLCKELRGIFLPCLSSVVTDIVEELEYYVSVLCSPSKVKNMKESKKRRRLSAESSSKFEEADLIEHVRPLQPLLLCLERALKADAHEGGGWVRVDDAQRYQIFLSPLSKLLHANVPKEFPIQTDDGANVNATSTYEMLVEGAGTLECGNVSACLTALAAAAGNEQLWKSLNHAVLTACGDEGRAEVRKAGVKTLLSVLQTIGEEYMVLLPECLPCLSELLEDGDENIAGMARECVRLGEELLGESLYDSIS